MTEKRFMLDDAGEVIDLQTAKFIEYGEEIVECLNNLHEENQKLLTLSNMKKGALVEAVKDLIKENEQLKQDNNALIHLLENQSMIIGELHSKLLEYQVKEPIALTKKDLELMDKAISYYTHGRCGE